jgi:TetR/AcrR family transcriptional regulator
MRKRLTDAQRQSILENAINLIGTRGIARTTIRDIAEASGVSVGVIYKYYQDKRTLFEACLDHSLKFLSDTITSASAQSTSLTDAMERLARVSLLFAKEHPEYIRMYYAITGSAYTEETQILARRIEAVSAHEYTAILERAQKAGEIRDDVSPRILAFCFDNLLMMLHFTGCWPYYEARREVYCGDMQDEALIKGVVAFVKAGLGLNSSGKIS